MLTTGETDFTKRPKSYRNKDFRHKSTLFYPEHPKFLDYPYSPNHNFGAVCIFPKLFVAAGRRIRNKDGLGFTAIGAVHAPVRRTSGEFGSMLQKNPLCPPAPFREPLSSAPGPVAAVGRPFISAEDFDATGILAGMDACESRYWWMPELHDCGHVLAEAGEAGLVRDHSGREAAFLPHDRREAGRQTGQATSRGTSASRPTAA